jgi:alcohol dehydrogenase/L-iditol 2-dehydrogenase
MRAVVLDRSPLSLRLADNWPEPEAGPGEVVVQVRGVGICGSDLSLHSARRHPPSFPWVVGHETLGEIAAVGAGVDSRRVGQRVVIEPNFPCLACPVCESGRTSACPDRISLGFSAPGTLAEKVAVPARFAWPVPGNWTDGDAVCAEPLTVARAAIRRAGERAAPELGCLVIGAGSQGALLCLALMARGITPSVLEPQPGRRALAAELGARPAAAGEAGFGLIFETSGATGALGEAVDRAAAGALVVMIGQSSQPVPLVTQTVVQRQLTLAGSLIYDHPDDFAGTMKPPGPPPELPAADHSGAGIAARVLRACYPMAEAETAFRAARAVPGKTWIRLD